MRGWAGRGADLAPLFGKEPSLAAAVSRSPTGSTGQVEPWTGPAWLKQRSGWTNLITFS